MLDNNDIYAIFAKLGTLERDVAVLKERHDTQTHQTVAFMAYLTHSITGSNYRIYFDDVKLNIGNAYFPQHGTFTTPVNGTYQFTVTACSTSGHFVVLALTSNTSDIGKVIAGDTDYIECTSNTFLAQLQAGDEVFVKHGGHGDYLYADSNVGLPSFTGVLVSSD